MPPSQDKPVIVTTGVGQHQCWVPRHFDFDAPERALLTSSGHGTMGYDLPAAIGAKIANPDATVICFVGDGSLQMNIQELATIVERGLDIKIVVLDNHALSIVAQFQRQNWKSHPSTGDKYNPDFAAIAAAYGIAAVTIDHGQGPAREDRRGGQSPGPGADPLPCRSAGRPAAHAAGRPDPGCHVQPIVLLMAAQPKLALVTGAGSGIGKAAALALLEAGYQVACGYNANRAGAEAIRHPDAQAVKIDIASRASIRARLGGNAQSISAATSTFW